MLLIMSATGCATGERAPPAAPACVPISDPGPRPTALIAGSGAALAFAKAALRGRAARVATSIGSRGAIAAVRAGAVDVGLSLRPGPADLSSHELARVPLVLAVGASYAGPALHLAPAIAALRATLGGGRDQGAANRSWRWVTREAGDSGLRVLRREQPALAKALADARDRGLTLVAHTDQEQHALLATTPGSVGLVDLGTVRLTAAALRTFPPDNPRLTLRLYALTARDPGPRATEMVHALQTFAASEEARRAGYRR